MAELMESLAKSIFRIEGYTRQTEFGDATLEQVKVRVDKLEQYYARFIKAHEKQVERAPKKANNYDDLVAQVETRYFAAHSSLVAKLHSLTPIQAPAPTVQQQPLAVQVSWPHQQHDFKNTWGEFDGTITKWPGFRDRFIAAIHSNESVSPAFKFSYLKKSLVGKAARTLGEWQLTDENYIEAWARLKQLYDKKYPICREHLRQLLRLPNVEGPPRPNDLQRMSNVTHEVLRQLRAQGIPVEGWDMIVVHILHERLDAETSKQWELQRESETPTIKHMLEFLDRQASALANVVDVHRSRSYGTNEAIGSNRGVESKGNRERKRDGANIKPAFGCVACGGDHPIWACGEFMGLSLRAREELVKKHNLCRNCLKRGHTANSCFQGSCPRCPGQVKHNSILCPTKEVAKQALIVKDVGGHNQSQYKRKSKVPSTKQQKNLASDYVQATQFEERAGFSAIDNEIKRVDLQLSLLDKQEQLFKRRKIVLEQEKDCNVIEREINVNQKYEKYFNYNLDIRPALLPTVMVRLEADGQCFGPLRALLDSGAQPNIIASSLYDRYKFPSLPATRKMIGIEGKSIGVSRRAILKVKPWFDSISYIEEEFWILPSENNWEPVLPNTESRPHTIRSSLPIELADPEYWKPDKVLVILNVRVFAKVLLAVRPMESDGITYIETRLGLVVCGIQEALTDTETGRPTSQINCTSVEELGELVRRFWQLDEIATCSKRTEEEEKVEQFFLETYSRDNTGRFTVSIPLKGNISNIGCSRNIALHRFLLLEKRMERDPDAKKQYVKFMNEYEHLGHMEQALTPVEPGKMVYYIPHHCVTKKFRVVFDASCPTDKGISLNDIQMLGEKIQRDLAEIIMRFRRHKVGVIGDIKMMFRQVLVSKEQWNLQRIFWRDSSSEPLKEYCLKVVTYGMTSSAFNAVRAVIQCARDAAEEYPEASKIIENDLYMDDCITGAESEEQATKIAKSVQHILRGGGFEMKKWKSNSKNLVKDMRSEEEEASIFTDEERATVLGLKWNIARDQFSFVVKTPKVEGVITKRLILSCVAQLYDPNGYISPITMMRKILMQDLWRLGLEWDTHVGNELEERFREYWEGMVHLESFFLDRWIGISHGQRVELHGFSDASTMAYGAVIYVRVEDTNSEAKATLLVSKSRVAPMKTISVPRLELAAAELLSRLLTEVIRAMEFSEITYTLWTDSQVVLHWINKIPRNLKTFVANRVSSIQTNTDVKRWRYISTKDNPADCLSRGMKPSEIVKNKLWMHGPEWLRKKAAFWPDCVFVPNTAAEAEDECKVFSISSANEPLQISRRATKERIALIDYVDKLDRAVNVVAYLFKFISKIRTHAITKRKKRGEIDYTAVSNEHKAKAMNFLLRQEQEKFYGKEIACLKSGKQIPHKSKIEPLKPVMREGLLRVHGRLKNSNLSENMRHPVIVPNGSRLEWLIMDHAHRETKHGGVQVMMQFIRQNYWIPRLRSSLRQYLHKCMVCVRHSQRTESQLMADLPADRVRAGKPFLHVGVDYAGPTEIKMIDREGSQIIRQKVWIAIFVCLKTRAVHVDVVSDLTTVAFIACYERFIARRGRCERIYSDNGTAFVGAAKEIRRAVEYWYRNEMFQHLSMKGTEWIFMTPAAPHQGGIYEAAVKSMKHHLIRVIGLRVLPFEQLRTLLAQIEAILNSRPLQPLSDDPDDLQALTPGHFITGEPLVLPLPFDIPETSSSKGIQLWRERQRMVKCFWERWHSEYLTSLQERKKWQKSSERIKLGQLVLIKSENFPPTQWAIGRIIELHSSADNLVRSVTIQTSSNILRRPVQKICILPMELNEG